MSDTPSLPFERATDELRQVKGYAEGWVGDPDTGGWGSFPCVFKVQRKWLVFDQKDRRGYLTVWINPSATQRDLTALAPREEWRDLPMVTEEDATR